MLYTENLEELIFSRHEHFQSDELIVLSGYVGIQPIKRMESLPFNSKVICGMYGDKGIKRILHNSLIGLQAGIKNIDIYYSSLPVHAKCYVWRNKGQIVHALIGSANFSDSGLKTPYREILAETTHDSFNTLNKYLAKVLTNSKSCMEVGAIKILEKTLKQEICSMTLLMSDGKIHNASGLNWGYMKNGKPSNKRGINDACIPIKKEHILKHPELFPPLQPYPLIKDKRGRRQRHNDIIEIIWDDEVAMEGLLEGSQVIDNVAYPKQICSFPVKKQLGEYLRNRISVPLGQPVKKSDLKKYGRTEIEVSILGDGIYSLAFSV